MIFFILIYNIIILLNSILIVSFKNKSIAIFIAWLSLCIYLTLSVTYYEQVPDAIDVYRNKTTLEITYRDNIPIDTVVVFK